MAQLAKRIPLRSKVAQGLATPMNPESYISGQITARVLPIINQF